MSDENYEHGEVDGKGERSRRRHDESDATPASNSETTSRSQSQGRHIDRVAGHVQRAREEHHEDGREPLEGELVSKEDIRREVLQIVTSVWSGPTPSPETLEQFNQVDPTFAERAFKMSEQTIETSNYERRKLVDGDVDAVKRGQWMTWIVSTTFGICALLLGLKGHTALAGLFLAPPLFQYFGNLIRTVRTKEKDNGNMKELEKPSDAED